LPAKFEIQEIDLGPSGLNEISALLKTTWPGMKHLNAAYLGWQYNDNPSGRAIGFNAYHGNQLVGHYATQPFKALIAGTEEMGLLSLNTAIHPEYRSSGLFYTLTMRTLKKAGETGYKFIVGIANANSTLPFIKLCGFQLVGQLEAKLGIGNIRRHEAEKEPFYKRCWDKNTLQWRLNRPGRPYLIKGHDASYSAVYANTGILGIFTELGIFENKMIPKRPGGFPGVNPFRLWIGLDSNSNWSRSLYIDIPKRLRPSPLNFIFKDLTGQKRSIKPGQSRFALIDFDAY